MRSMLYIVYGIGSDSVGLVDKITTPIAKVNGNIVDLRQDVLHGLFTIYLVVDLKKATLDVEGFAQRLKDISVDTGLTLSMERYTPMPDSSVKNNILLIMVGKDRPGIIAAISEKLGAYNINIESSKMVARENIFLMELLTDVSKSALPLDNLKTVVREIMQAMDIAPMFQTQDVFNKKKKVILFDITRSFIDAETMKEIMQLAGILEDNLRPPETDDQLLPYMQTTAGFLENLPLEVIETVIQSIKINQATTELLLTLKMMGYAIGLVSNGFSFFTDSIMKRLYLDYSFGHTLPIDDDSKTIVGDLPAGLMQGLDRLKILFDVMEREGVDKEDIALISDRDMDIAQTPGIQLKFDMKVMLDMLNQHVLSKESLTGLLRSFGLPRL